MEITSTPKHRHKQSHVLEHTLHGISETLERAFFAEEISTRPGLFQSLDPRVKIISVLALLISVSLSRSLLVIAGIYLVTLIFGLACRSRLASSSNVFGWPCRFLQV